MSALILVVRLSAVRAGRVLSALSRAVAWVRRAGPVRRELASRNGAAARLAVLNHAEREARLYGLSDAALGALLIELGKDVRAGRFKR